MVARIATRSCDERPCVTPLYFIYLHGRIWLGTAGWTLAAHNVRANPRVNILFEAEQDASAHRVLQIRGRASVRTEQKIQHSYDLRATQKYFLTSSGSHNTLAHIPQLPFMHKYHAQSAEKNSFCVIEVIPEQANFLNNGMLADSQTGSLF
jgi:general stress protein 26